MSRRKNPRPDRLVVEVELLCDACGARLGWAYQHRGQHPQTGQSVVDGRVGTLVDRPQGGQKLACHPCSACGARPQVLWARIVESLNEIDGVRTYRVSHRI